MTDTGMENLMAQLADGFVLRESRYPFSRTVERCDPTPLVDRKDSIGNTVDNCLKEVKVICFHPSTTSMPEKTATHR